MLNLYVTLNKCEHSTSSYFLLAWGDFLGEDLFDDEGVDFVDDFPDDDDDFPGDFPGVLVGEDMSLNDWFRFFKTGLKQNKDFWGKWNFIETKRTENEQVGFCEMHMYDAKVGKGCALLRHGANYFQQMSPVWNHGYFICN